MENKIIAIDIDAIKLFERVVFALGVYSSGAIGSAHLSEARVQVRLQLES